MKLIHLSDFEMLLFCGSFMHSITKYARKSKFANADFARKSKLKGSEFARKRK